MKKLALLIASSLLLSSAARSNDVTRDFTLIYDVAYTCTISVTNNNIEGKSLVLGLPTTADVTFGCTDLDGAILLVSSKNGGLIKGEDTSKPIHYLARVTATGLAPTPLTLDTERDGKTPVSGVFNLDTPTSSIDGELQVILKTPTTFTPEAGRYEDVVTLTLRSPLASPS